MNEIKKKTYYEIEIMHANWPLDQEKLKTILNSFLEEKKCLEVVIAKIVWPNQTNFIIFLVLEEKLFHVNFDYSFLVLKEQYRNKNYWESITYISREDDTNLKFTGRVLNYAKNVAIKNVQMDYNFLT